MITLENISKMTDQEQFADYFSKLYFNAEMHQYTVGYGATLMSVTSLIKKYTQPFKSHQIASQVAKSKAKKGLPADKSYYLRYWHTKGALAREKGNLLHLYAGELPNVDIPQTLEEEAVLAYYTNVIVAERNEVVLATELPIYYKGLAGTGDLITIKEDGTLHIYDWKTSAEFDKSYNKFLAPFDSFRDTNRNKYTMQLVLYKWIIESMTPYTVSEMTIVKIDETGYEEIELNEDLEEVITKVIASKNDSNGDNL